MTRGTPVFGTLSTFGEAYPDIVNIRVRWEQDRTHTLDPLKGGPEGYFWYGPEDGRINDHIPCANTFCNKGCIDWMTLFDEMRQNGETERKDVRIRCSGREPMGSGSRKCLNHAKVSIEIAYKKVDGDEQTDP